MPQSILSFETKLVKAMNENLPGQSAQAKMSVLSNHHSILVKSDAKVAAVCAILERKSDGSHDLIFIKRAIVDGDRHSGQISFPGGKIEPQDESFIHTACREVEEEIGVPLSNSEIIGPLTPLYIPISNFKVYPFVAIVDQISSFTIQTSEVDQVIRFPLASLSSQEIAYKDLKRQQIKLKQVPYYQLNEMILWGATAMMCNELLEIVRKF